MRWTQVFQALLKMFFAGIWTTALSACAIVDNAGLHTETLNESIADYNAYAILLNIVRASESEPLNFVAVSQGSPNTSFSGTATLPTFTFSPPHHLASYTTPGNSLSATTSDALTVQPIDDPASWQALLTPIDVGTIGFFIKQGYSPELLFWLFVDRIRICVDPSCKDYEELIGNPDYELSFQKFEGLLPSLIQAGLTVEVERGPPKGGKTPSSKICFDKSAALYADEAKRKLPLAPGARAPTPYPPEYLPRPNDCSTAWLAGQQTASSGQQGGGDSSSKGTASVPQPLYVYLNYLNPDKVPKSKSQGETSAWYDLPQDLPYYARRAALQYFFLAHKRVPWGAKLKIQFSTRSAYGVYLFLGRALAKGRILELEYTDSDPYILRVTRDQTSNCFTQLVYNSKHYCVPAEAYNTKRMFAIVHQLVGLNIAYTSTPAVLNVRTLP